MLKLLIDKIGGAVPEETEERQKELKKQEAELDQESLELLKGIQEAFADRLTEVGRSYPDIVYVQSELGSLPALLMVFKDKISRNYLLIKQIIEEDETKEVTVKNCHIYNDIERFKDMSSHDFKVLEGYKKYIQGLVTGSIDYITAIKIGEIIQQQIDELKVYVNELADELEKMKSSYVYDD